MLPPPAAAALGAAGPHVVRDDRARLGGLAVAALVAPLGDVAHDGDELALLAGEQPGPHRFGEGDDLDPLGQRVAVLGRHVGGGHVDPDAAGREHLLALLDESWLVGEVAAVGGVAAAGDRAGDVAAHRLVVSFPFRSGGSLPDRFRGRGLRGAHAPVEGADPAAQGVGELFGRRPQGWLSRTRG